LDKSKTSCAGGSFYAGYCPGAVSIQCCIKGGLPPGPAPPNGPSGGGKKQINQDGIDLIKGFEGWYSCYYKDPVGLPTIGYGHLIKSGDPYHAGTCLSKQQGEDLLRKDLSIFVGCVNGYVKVSLTCNEFAALVSWAFNVGCGNVASSTLIKILNGGNKGGVCGELAKWNKAGGKVLAGLTRRRQAECNLFKHSGGGSC
jgi:GH24 family phage-related lysozyme (muramidase)